MTLLAGDTEFPRRSLVVHVNLSLGVWFFCNLAGLFCLLPAARKFRTAPAAAILATLGVVVFSIPFLAATGIVATVCLRHRANGVRAHAIAGSFGDAARKVYGQAPAHECAWLRMAIAGAGGAGALVGGIIFVLVVIKTMLRACNGDSSVHKN